MHLADYLNVADLNCTDTDYYIVELCLKLFDGYINLNSLNYSNRLAEIMNHQELDNILDKGFNEFINIPVLKVDLSIKTFLSEDLSNLLQYYYSLTDIDKPVNELPNSKKRLIYASAFILSHFILIEI